jgi:DNA-binding CsgD family transcriptional regulator
MANELGIGQRTVDTHVQALYRKLGVCNRHELLQKVLGKGRLDRQG